MGRAKKFKDSQLAGFTRTEKGLLALLGLIAVAVVVLLIVRR